MEKKVRIEFGYECRQGETTQAYGLADPVMDRLLDLCDYGYTRIEVDENLPYSEKRAGRFERRRRMYRANVPEESVEELVNLIPEDNPYGIYVKEI